MGGLGSEETSGIRDKFSTRQTIYNKRYDNLSKPEVESLAALVNKGTVLDLGCGLDAWRMALFAHEQLGATRYMGIDIHTDFPRRARFRYNLKTGKKPDPVEVEFINQDMSEFLSQQPDNSASITLNGIDDYVIDPKIEGNINYVNRLAEEIARVVGDNHCVFGNNSSDIFATLEKLGYKKEPPLVRFSDLNIYRKV